MKITSEAQGLIAWGLCLMLICLGVGGCIYMADVGQAKREAVELSKPKEESK